MLLKYSCLIGCIACLWKAFSLYCTEWYRQKVYVGICKVHQYLIDLKERVLLCTNVSQLLDVVSNVPSKLKYDIAIEFGSDLQSIDYEYTYNISDHLQSIDKINKHTNISFDELKNDLLDDIDRAIKMLQIDDH